MIPPGTVIGNCELAPRWKVTTQDSSFMVPNDNDILELVRADLRDRYGSDDHYTVKDTWNTQ